jgi:translocation protein SEC63
MRSNNYAEQSRLLLHLPQLLNALLTVSTSRSWLLPTLSIMRLHAYLAQAVMPGDNRFSLAQLPGIQADDVKELESQVTELEDFVEILDMRGDDRVGDIRKAVQNWGRLELVDASFKGWHFCCTEEIG